MTTRVASRHPQQSTLVLAVLAAGLAVLLAPHPAVAQEVPAWTPLFRMSVQGGYDDNPFRLSARQRLRIADGRAAYRDIEHVHDFVSLLRLRGELRSLEQVSQIPRRKRTSHPLCRRKH